MTLSIPVYASEVDGGERLITSIAIKLLEDGYKTSCPGMKIIFSEEKRLEDYLDANPLVLLGVDGSMVEGNYRYFSPNSLDVKLPEALLEASNWGATKIYQESMGAEKNLDTVQGFTYSKIANDYAIVFNDDGKGEIADLVAIRENKGVIYIDLYHCKYCSQTKGGRSTRRPSG